MSRPIFFYRKDSRYPNLSLNNIIGDGSCFVHCFLDTLSKTYKTLSSEEKSLMATKTRLDLANILLSDSDKEIEDIAIRCNLLIPAVISKFFEPEIEIIDGKEVNLIIGKLDKIKDEFIDNCDVLNIYNAFEKVTELGLIWSKFDLPDINSRPLESVTFEELLFIYSRDYRENYYLSDSIIYVDYDKVYSPKRKTEYGIGLVPLNIKFFEMVKEPPMSHEMFRRLIGVLISDSSLFPSYEQEYRSDNEYLTHAESDIFVKFLNINVVAIVQRGGYSGEVILGGYKEGYPILILANKNADTLSAHWETISLETETSSNFLFKDIDRRLYQELHRILNSMH